MTLSVGVLNVDGAMEKRSITIKGHRTSIALEPEFWRVLETAAKADGVTLPGLIAGIDAARVASLEAGRLSHSGSAPTDSLASALRVFALKAAASVARDETD